MGLFVEGVVRGIKAGGPVTLASGAEAGKTVTERPKLRVEDEEGGAYLVVVISPPDVKLFSLGEAVRLPVVARGNTFRPGSVTLFGGTAGSDPDRW